MKEPIRCGKLEERERKRKRVEESKKVEEEQNWRMGDQKVEFPAIKPKHKLQFNFLKGNDLITIPNFFTSFESEALIKAAESLGFAHQGSLGPTKGEAYRDNDRVSVNNPQLADIIWEAGLNKLFRDIKIRGKAAVGLNPNIRFYRYKAGQRFGRHIDESVDLGDGKHTHYTLLIYLSGSSQSKGKSDVKSLGNTDPLVGGETVFYGSRSKVVAEVAPAEGMALVHIHGDKCMLHEARNVTKGVNHGRTCEGDEQGIWDHIWKHYEQPEQLYTPPVDMFDHNNDYRVLLDSRKLQWREAIRLQGRGVCCLEPPFRTFEILTLMKQSWKNIRRIRAGTLGSNIEALRTDCETMNSACGHV